MRKIRTRCKAQSELISHTLTILFGVILVIVVVTMISNLKKDYQEYAGKLEAREICNRVRAGIEKIYFNTTYDSPTTEESGSAVLELPGKIADMNYRVGFSGTNITVTSLGRPEFTHTCPAGFDLTYSGGSGGGMTTIKWNDKSTSPDTIVMYG